MRIAVALHRDHAVGAPLLLPRHGDDAPHGDRYRLALQGQTDPWVLPAILVCENNHREVILTLGSSRTVLEFLCAAKEKKRSFRVFVAEGAPRYQGRLLANDLVTRGLQTTLITDSAVIAMISRVNMVIVGAHAVMANGGVTAPVGMFLWLNILQLCQNRQLHPINQAAYKFYLGVRGIFCEQRTMEKQLHFLQVLKDIF